MRTLLLAIRNLLRNRRRSLATLLAMAVGSTSILLFGGYSKNIQYSMETAYVRSGGHLQIQHRDFNNFGSGNPTAYGIADGARLLAAIRSDEVLGKLVLVASQATTTRGCRAPSWAWASWPTTTAPCATGTATICH